MIPWKILCLMLMLSLGLVFATTYSDCMGPSTQCCVKPRYELYPKDELVIRSWEGSSYSWCDQVIIVRRNNEQYDECSGCTLTVEFSSDTSINPRYWTGAQLEFLEANYTSMSYYTSETLYLDYLARYNATKYLPSRLTSNGNLLKIQASTSGLMRPMMRFTLKITPNVPDSGSGRRTPNIPYEASPESYTAKDVGILLSIMIPIFGLLLFLLITGIAIRRIRQRRIARLQGRLNQRVSRVIIATLMERELRAQEMRQRHPRSPDPNDFIAPPSYTEALPPPSYDEVIGNVEPELAPQQQQQTCATDNISDVDPIDLVEDCAGEDTGSDTARLVA